MLSAAWKRVLLAPRTQKQILLTIVYSEASLLAKPHPAVTPGALRASTGGATPVDAATGRMFPFAATIMAWPDIKREFSPVERRAPVASVQVALTRNAKFPHDAVGPGTPPAVWARLDLWSPGIDLRQAIPLIAGPVTAAPYDYRHGGVVLTIEDGDTLRSVQFPPGQQTIEVGEFPDAPDLVIGQARRQVIFGPFPDPVPCIPISRDGRRWYLCEPAAVVPPSSFQIGGAEVALADRPLVTVGRLASDPTRTFTELVFGTSVANLGLYGNVTAGGGVGVAVDSAPVTLLRDIGGYRLSARAERDFLKAARLFNFSVFSNEGSSVLDIVRDRILPQTNLAMTLHLNQVETFELLGNASERHLGLGYGLWAYVPTRYGPSTSDTVYSAIEVGFVRNTIQFAQGGTTLTRNAFVVDASYGGPIGGLLAKSQMRYGRRQLTIQAADLVDDSRGGVPASVVALGELAARLSAVPHRQATYECMWDVGMGLDLNDRVFLTDPNEDFDKTPTRVVGWALPATGPRITFQTEDAKP